MPKALRQHAIKISLGIEKALEEFYEISTEEKKGCI